MMQVAVSKRGIDATTLAVLRGAFQQVATEMDLTIRRSAFSPIITEMADRGSGLYERGTGATIAQGAESLPVFVCTMQFALQRLIEVLQTRGELQNIQEGDVFAFNDPYFGGTHVQDLKLMTPHFWNGKLFCWLAVTGHWSDMGGPVPGSFVPNAEECFAEGLRIPPVRLFSAGRLQQEIADFILENVRMRDILWGDMEAMISALRVGGKRMNGLLEKYGPETIDAAVAELRDRSEAEMRAILSEMPNGIYEFHDFIDNDGFDEHPIEIRLKMTVDNDRALLDFSGSAAPTRGPLNLAYNTTFAGAMIAIKHLFPDVQINSGCFAPYRFVIPQSTFLHAVSPRAVGGYLESIARVVTVVLGAFTKALPGRVPADWYGTSLVITIAGDDRNGRPFVFTQRNAGGMGAFNGADGLVNAPSLQGYARYANVESIEQRWPLLFKSRALWTDSGGNGEFRGGPGTESEIEALGKPVRITIIGDRSRFPPFGVGGGLPAKGAEVEFIRNNVRNHQQGVTKFQQVSLQPGDSVILRTPGGGGWGLPENRKMSAVVQDVQEGYISTEAARDVYGKQSTS